MTFSFISGVAEPQQLPYLAESVAQPAAWALHDCAVASATGAWAALFLASDEARWISGVILPVDAGLLAATPLAMFPYLRETE
jgi:NAD(P)-dependent dehydrogenase (short-subunit alcohol dehydrogenase family)